MRNLKRIVFVFSMLWLSAVVISCIEPVDIETDSSSSASLVINGLITDEPGPYKVELSLSTGFFDDDVSSKVSNALVTIEDDLGQKHDLEESSPGIYLTSASEVVGEVGRQYILTVELEDGRTFESSTERLNSNSGMSSIYSEYKTKAIRNDFNILDEKEGLDIFIDSNPRINNEVFYRWRWTGTYEFSASPELVTVTDHHQHQLARPLPCSGYVPVGPNLMHTLDKEKISECTCCECWVEEFSQNVFISNYKSREIGSEKKLIDFLEINNRRFAIKYHITVDQISLSRSGYEFWYAAQQQQSQSSIFATTLGSIPTNIKAINNTDKVLGYFGASSIKKVSKFISQSEIPTPITADPYLGSCKGLDNSTTTRPDFW